MALTVVIAYDIRQDSRRARVAAHLQMWGDRIQRSVFVCIMEDTALTDLTARIGEIIDPDTDSVHVLRQCANCWDDVAVLGQATTRDDKYYWVIL